MGELGAPSTTFSILLADLQGQGKETNRGTGGTGENA